MNVVGGVRARRDGHAEELGKGDSALGLQCAQGLHLPVAGHLDSRLRGSVGGADESDGLLVPVSVSVPLTATSQLSLCQCKLPSFSPPPSVCQGSASVRSALETLISALSLLPPLPLSPFRRSPFPGPFLRFSFRQTPLLLDPAFHHTFFLLSHLRCTLSSLLDSCHLFSLAPPLFQVPPMRRIAAVFSSKRDRSDAASSSAASTTTEQTQTTAKSSKRFFRSISRRSRPVDPAFNSLNSGDFHPPSSSSSSSGAPTTPDDDRGSLLKVSTSKVWSPLPPIPIDSSLAAFHRFVPTSHDRKSLLSGPRPTPSQSTLEDASSEECSVAPDLSRQLERSLPLTAPAYLLSLTSSKLGPPYAPPPLLDVPGGPEFPRSCNARRSLSQNDSLESNMLRARLQRRLQRGDLSPSETRSIASFTGRRAASKDRPSLLLDDTAVRVGHIRPASVGLRKWVERPCFEDRLGVLLAENLPAGGLNAYGECEPMWTRVEPATGCGVADLEYSLTLELLAGLYEDILPSEHSQERQGPAPDTSAFVPLRLDTQLPLDLGPSLTFTQPTITLSPSSSLPGASTPATMSSTSLVTASSNVGLRPVPGKLHCLLISSLQATETVSSHHIFVISSTVVQGFSISTEDGGRLGATSYAKCPYQDPKHSHRTFPNVSDKFAASYPIAPTVYAIGCAVPQARSQAGCTLR